MPSHVPSCYRSIITKRTAIAMLTVVWILSALIAFVPIYSGWNTADGRVQNVGNDTCVFAVESVPYSLTIGGDLLHPALHPLPDVRQDPPHLLRPREGDPRADLPQHQGVDGDGGRRSAAAHLQPQPQHPPGSTGRPSPSSSSWGPSHCAGFPTSPASRVNPLHALQLNPVVEEVFLWMGYSNSFVNPFVYGMTNRESIERRSGGSSAAGSAGPSSAWPSYSHSQSHTRSDHEHTVMMPNAHETDLICM
ncbi:hypothetical protein BV898_12993 [Hypsibius exemplaris]|uniref:G-protein coupled receptors family 1 profile domain-containing protein n=1 Tax=Hypsibius exemplaris TaxID=2072580 RepID=A0A1W0WC35_HYPEX|nr:hypothetical protein BV898_12993 [Hypsibius exemplaris]